MFHCYERLFTYRRRKEVPPPLKFSGSVGPKLF